MFESLGPILLTSGICGFAYFQILRLLPLLAGLKYYVLERFKVFDSRNLVSGDDVSY